LAIILTKFLTSSLAIIHIDKEQVKKYFCTDIYIIKKKKNRQREKEKREISLQYHLSVYQILTRPSTGLKLRALCTTIGFSSECGISSSRARTSVYISIFFEIQAATRDRGCHFVSPILRHTCTYTRVRTHTTSLVSRYTRDLRDRLILSADSSRFAARRFARVCACSPNRAIPRGTTRLPPIGMQIVTLTLRRS